MKKKQEKEHGKRISVRLNEDSTKKLISMQEKGYTTSEYINKIINNESCVADIGCLRKIMLHVSNLQTELEYEENVEIKKNMRRELNEICLVLKSLVNPT